MQKTFTLVSFILLCQLAHAQSWTLKATFTGEVRGRSGAFADAANGKGYIIAGGHFWYLPSSFVYDTLTDSWNTIADYPGYDDDPICGFINGKGYAVTGGSCCPAYDGLLYEYDPVADSWTQPSTMPGEARTFAVGFVLNNKLYVGGGVNNQGLYGCSNSHPLNDFYAYDPSTNTWDTLPNCPAAGVNAFAVGFAINGKGYVGTGAKVIDGDCADDWVPQKDFWEYDPTVGTKGTWIQVADFGGGPRAGAVGYATCDKGYVATGYTDSLQSVYTNDFWTYDPVKDAWTQLVNYGGVARKYASVFVIGKSAYVGLGSTPDDTSDFYEYTQSVIPAFTTANSSAPTICAGQSVSFSDTSNYAPTNWQWNFLGGTPDTSTAQNPVITYNTPGMYDVTLTAWNGCDSASKTFTQYVTVTTAPVVSVLPTNPQLCSGQSVTLQASGGISYQWVGTTDTTDSLVVSPSKDTTYELLVSNGSCTKDTFIAVHTGGVLNVNVAPQSPTICSGQSITLKASGGYTYNWSPSIGLAITTGDSVIANPTASITYTVTASDTLGCSGIGYDTLTVVPVPNTPTISQHGDTLVSSASTENQWYLNGVAIGGATGQDLIIGNTTGVYTVAVINPADGCTSNSGADTTSGINQLKINSSQLSIYPNPTSGNITVQIVASSTDIKDWNLQLTDVLGRTVYIRNSLNYTNEIDLTNLPGGVYFITVNNKTGEAVFKVVKQ